LPARLPRRPPRTTASTPTRSSNACATPTSPGTRAGGEPQGLEHAGRAAQTAADWSDEYSTKLLDRSAELVAQKCTNYDIPATWLTAAQLRAGKRGITGHVQVSQAFKRTDHTDPGKSFPVAAYIARVRAHLPHPPRLVPARRPHRQSRRLRRRRVLRNGDKG
jgi:hypothetical protein